MYKLKHHKNLASRWYKFSQSQQILMIANELNRAKNLMKRKDSVEVMNAYERAFELLDLTISITQTNLMRYELLRFREMLGHLYITKYNNIETVDKLLRVLISLDKDSYNALNP